MNRLERRHQPLASTRVFIRRLLTYLAISIAIITFSLGIGVLGYHYLENLSWLDALLNASMILGGMGPVDPLHTAAGKLFASFYALFSGMVFLVAVGVLIAPIFHRFLHAFHIAEEDVDGAATKASAKSTRVAAVRKK